MFYVFLIQLISPLVETPRLEMELSDKKDIQMYAIGGNSMTRVEKHCFKTIKP